MKNFFLLILITPLLSCNGDESSTGNLDSGLNDNKTNSFWRDPMTNMEFMSIPGGCFLMGSLETEYNRSSDEFQHEVCVDGFLMGKYEVTKEEWEKVMGDHSLENDDLWRYPVEGFSWNEIQNYIFKLNQNSDLTFRLPTEAEWEYAARAGTETIFHYGDSLNFKQAKFNANFPYPHSQRKLINAKRSAEKVGNYEANEFGLHDMHGNVSEFCADWYGESYYRGSVNKNPQGPATGDSRVRRGGQWRSNAIKTRSANRERLSPDYISEFGIGFRLVINK